MTFFDLVKKRRSIRSYSPQTIKREDLELCTEAARLAPSACNSQPWKFIIVDTPEQKEKIIQTLTSGPYKMNSFAAKAGAFIVIVSERVKLASWLGGKIRGTCFRRIDAGIACEHIVLQAADVGIGTCILGWFNERRIKSVLSVPWHKKIDLIISLGYPENSTLPGKRIKNKNETVGYNRY